TTIAQTKLQNQKILLAEQQLNVTKAELIKNVSIAYYQLLFAQQKLKLLSQLDSVYSNFAKYADTKFRVGESNQLEKLSAQAKLKEIQIQKQQAESDLKIVQSTLQQWTGTANNFSIDESNYTLPPPPVLDTSQIYSNPYLQFQKQQLNASVAEWKLEKNKYAPSLQFGYFTQSLDKLSPFNGYNIGLSIPIFKTGQQGRINAASLQAKIESKNLEALQLNLKTEYTAALEEYNKQNASLNYYNSEGLPLAENLFSVASKSYSSGDISYVEYIQNISQAYQIKTDYAQAVFNLNQSVIHINYLINK
ncbi:MAG: TolC family protein, partial [Bacteroidota bacterium]